MRVVGQASCLPSGDSNGELGKAAETASRAGVRPAAPGGFGMEVRPAAHVTPSQRQDNAASPNTIVLWCAVRPAISTNPRYGSTKAIIAIVAWSQWIF